MSMNGPLLMEWDQEMAGARTTLERAPWDQVAWRPHAKSWTLGELATHVARVPGWATETLNRDELDLAAADYAELRKVPATHAELLALFDRNAAAGRAALAAMPDAALGQPWTLKTGDQRHFTLPRGAVLRSMVFSHLVHHRAQLGVYLRLLDVPVPALYGPTADERPM